jgi:hypothetical protein
VILGKATLTTKESIINIIKPKQIALNVSHSAGMARAYSFSVRVVIRIPIKIDASASTPASKEDLDTKISQSHQEIILCSLCNLSV